MSRHHRVFTSYQGQLPGSASPSRSAIPMDKKVDEQLLQVKDSIRRAKAHPDKTGTFRRETFRRLIDLTHSPYSSLKTLAAGSIQCFVRYFPELEEAAINAVYDLCEDQDSEVRKAGYAAVTQVSRERLKWVKRNADVLVQLLQNDEPDEVVLVKKALVEHLDMDPSVTIGVLCDQILAPDEPLGEEDSLVRDRLRSLVLSFISREAKQAIVKGHIGQPDSDIQQTLIQALLAVIPRLDSEIVEVVVKDVMMSLPSIKEDPTQGNELLKLMLDQAKSSFRNDFRLEKPGSFTPTRQYIRLAKLIVIKEKLAPPVELLQFFCGSMIGKMTLQKLSADDRTSIISDTAEALSTCYEDIRCRTSSDFVSLQRQIVDACPILLEGLSDSGMPQIKSWKACHAFLRACLRRKNEHQWTVPANLLNLLHKIQTLPRPTREENEYRDVQGFIRILAQTNVKAAAQQQPSTGTSLGLNGNAEGPRAVEFSPGKPSATSPAVRSEIPGAPQGDGADAKAGLKIMGAHSDASIATAGKRPTLIEDYSRASKRVREREVDEMAPSLLSRMGNAVPNRSFTPETRSGGQDQSTPFQRIDSPEMSAGYSIRGAAEAERRSESVPGPTWSLLDRIKDDKSTGDIESARRKRRRIGRAHRSR